VKRPQYFRGPKLQQRDDELVPQSAAQESLNAVLGSARVAALHALVDECSALLRAGDEPEGETDE